MNASGRETHDHECTVPPAGLSGQRLPSRRTPPAASQVFLAIVMATAALGDVQPSVPALALAAGPLERVVAAANHSSSTEGAREKGWGARSRVQGFGTECWSSLYDPRMPHPFLPRQATASRPLPVTSPWLTSPLPTHCGPSTLFSRHSTSPYPLERLWPWWGPLDAVNLPSSTC